MAQVKKTRKRKEKKNIEKGKQKRSQRNSS